MKKRIDLKDRISIIITAINFATHMMPFFIMLPLLFLITIFSNELEIEWLGTILVYLFLFSIVIYVIGIFLAPLIQVVLMIVAMICKKMVVGGCTYCISNPTWWWNCIIFCSGRTNGVYYMMSLKRV